MALTLFSQKPVETNFRYLDIATGPCSPDGIMAYNSFMGQFTQRQFDQPVTFNWITFTLSWAYLNRDKWSLQEFVKEYQQALYDEYGFTVADMAVYSITGILGAIFENHFGEECHLLTDHYNNGNRRVVVAS
jgi:hypothetical protein